MTDWLTGLGVGLGNFFGLDIDPLAEQRKNLRQIQDSMQSMKQQNDLLLFQKQLEIDKTLRQRIIDNTVLIKQYIENNDELIWESIDKQNILTAVFGVLILLIVFYLIL